MARQPIKTNAGKGLNRRLRELRHCLELGQMYAHSDRAKRASRMCARQAGPPGGGVYQGRRHEPGAMARAEKAPGGQLARC